MAKENKKKESAGISREQLADMLQKYNIGKKPLSKLLGWGETTILLYLRGDDELPDNEYTRRLKELYVHTEDYIALLNNSQGRISDIARRRSMEAVRGLIPRTPIFEAAEYVMELHEVNSIGLIGESMSLLRLETILFWAQIISLSLYDMPMFDDDYMPGRAGLPYRAVEERVTRMGCIIPEGLYDESAALDSNLTELQRQILTYLSNMFDWFGTAALSELMEAERFRLCGPKGARKRRNASKEMLKKCYGEVFAQAKVRKLKDIDTYMQKRINYIRIHSEER